MKVGELLLPVDFVIIDADEDSRIPLILGRPFLATGKAKIKVAKGTISLKVNGKKAVFKIFDIKVKPQEQNDVFLLDMMDAWSDSKLEQFFLKGGFYKEKKVKAEGIPPEQVFAVKVAVIPKPKMRKAEKKPPPVEKKQPVQEPEKKGCLPWMSKFWKKKVAPDPILGDRVYYVFDAGLDEKIPHGATHQEYNPG